MSNERRGNVANPSAAQREPDRVESIQRPRCDHIQIYLYYDAGIIEQSRVLNPMDYIHRVKPIS